MSNHRQHVSPPNHEVSALKARQDGYDRVLRDFAANIIRLLELQLHTTHMLAGKRLLECPICIRQAEADEAARKSREVANG